MKSTVIKCVYIGILCSIISLNYTDAACTWPEDIEGTWIDSLKGDVTFSGTQMTGWTIEVEHDFGGFPNHVRDVWDCVNVDSFATDGYVIMKTNQTVEIFFFPMTVYRCIQMTKITDQSYRYYQIDPVQGGALYDRFTISFDDATTSTSTLCDHSLGASGTEYQVMIATGSEAAAKVQCPYGFVGLYDYTHSTFSGPTCSSTDGWNMCSDNTQITFGTNTCDTPVAYSESDTVWCVDNIPVDGTNYAMLYNHLDTTTNEPTTYRFSCIAVNAENTLVSISPHHCQASQVPSSYPVDNSAAIAGARLTLTQTSTVCPPCDVLDNPTAGSVVVYTEGATTIANYTCDPGNSLQGAQTRTCLVTGDWDPLEDPSCTCTSPVDPTNGTATMVFGENVTTVEYTCDAGYVLVGNAERTCITVNNSWTGSDPVCDECQSLTTPVSGALSIVSIGVTSQAEFMCDKMYSMAGVSDSFCLVNTTWNETEPSCTFCDILSTLFSGNIAYTTSGTVTSATGSCAPFYTLVGTNPLNCLSTGAWDNSLPICMCNTPPVPDNGTMVISNSNTTATYTCDLYFTMDAAHVRECETSGTYWSGTDPNCMECSVKTKPTNGTVEVSTNGTLTRAVFRCDLNYSMDGEQLTRCLDTEAWQHLDAVCNECDILYIPTGGTITLSTDGITTSSVYRCETGRTLNGASEPYCQSDGTWTDNAAAITCALCDPLTDFNQGSYSMTTNGTMTEVNFFCTTSFKLAGAATAYCDSSGQWDVLDQTCVGEDSSSEFPWLPIVIAFGSLLFLLLLVVIICIICNCKWYRRATGKGAIRKEKSRLSLRNIVITSPPPMNQRLMTNLSRAPSSMYQPSSRMGTAMSRRPPTRPVTSISRVQFEQIRQRVTPAPVIPNGRVSVLPPPKTPRPPAVTPRPPPVPPTPKPPSVVPPPTPRPPTVVPPPTPRPIIDRPPPTPIPLMVAPPPTPGPINVLPQPWPKPVTPSSIELVPKGPTPTENVQVAAPWAKRPASPDSYGSFEEYLAAKTRVIPGQRSRWDTSNINTASLKVRYERYKRLKELRLKQIELQTIRKRQPVRKRKKGPLTKGKVMLTVHEFVSNGTWKQNAVDPAVDNKTSSGVVKNASPVTTFMGRKTKGKHV